MVRLYDQIEGKIKRVYDYQMIISFNIINMLLLNSPTLFFISEKAEELYFGTIFMMNEFFYNLKHIFPSKE